MAGGTVKQLRDGLARLNDDDPVIVQVSHSGVATDVSMVKAGFGIRAMEEAKSTFS